ncbi:MAG TPA: hypothetical protein RMH99_22215 [Sandaracinaceae bacterium LLY-WYZ-13_1]|nr:hypothetical protein [Sandaracinaceae bacterium LLY-WYZ-13_1]
MATVAVCLAGCVPGFDGFTVVDPDGSVPAADGGPDGRDGGGDSDGGGDPGDAGTPGCDDALLACVARCEDLLAAVLGQADFDGDTGDFTMRPVSGGGSLEDGHLILSSPETWLLTRDQYAFGTVAGCAEVELTFDAVEDTDGFLFGLRGTEHGTLLRMRPATDTLQLATFEPAVTLVDAAPLTIPTGESARYEVLSFVTPGYAHAEARRVDGEGIAAAHGPYGGSEMPLEVELSFFAPDVARARVDRLVIGRLSDEARASLDAW